MILEGVYSRARIIVGATVICEAATSVVKFAKVPLSIVIVKVLIELM